MNHTSQTHFTDPAADYCYRCPLCYKTINKENLTDLIRLHFGMMHNDPHTEYSIIINGEIENPLIIGNLRKKGRNRDGAKPPAQEFMHKYCRELPASQPRFRKKRKEEDKLSKDKEEGQEDELKGSLDKKITRDDNETRHKDKSPSSRKEPRSNTLVTKKKNKKNASKGKGKGKKG